MILHRWDFQVDDLEKKDIRFANTIVVDEVRPAIDEVENVINLLVLDVLYSPGHFSVSERLDHDLCCVRRISIW